MNSFPKPILESAFSQLETKLAIHRRQQARESRNKAPDFNVFDFINPTENILSDILRFLLDPDESHGQANIFLAEILRRVRPHSNIPSHDATAVREALTYTLDRARRRRIDVLVTLADFHLAIETKKFASEGTQQIQDYCEHLDKIGGGRFCLIFLNQTGTEAESIAPELALKFQKQEQLVVWSWEKSILEWLRACRSNCEAAKIKHFVGDFGRYIVRYLASQSESGNDDKQ